MRGGRSWRPVAAGAGVFAVTLAVYLHTRAPGLTYVDSGELSAVAWTLGIAHPSGYPLFTLLGHLFCLLPTSGEVAARLNVMAALLTAAAAWAFFHLVLALFASSRRSRPSGEMPGGELAAASGGALGLAFSRTFWSQAVSVEVYALHLLLVAVGLLLFTRACGGAHAGQRSWNLFAFVLGLSFSNHLTTVLLAPGLLVYLLVRRREIVRPISAVLRAVPFFLLGLTPYVFLPLRALQHPPLSWGDVVNLDNFLRHVSGWQYRVWMLSPADVVGRQLARFLSQWPVEFGYAGLVLALGGAALLVRRDGKLFLFTLILFASSLLYAATYNIHDIDSYFLLAYIVTGIWGAFGLRALVAWLSPWRKIPRYVLLSLPLLLSLFPLAVNYRSADQRGNFVVEDYTENMFSSFAPNALVLSYQWDYWVSAANEYQLVRGLRKDVIVLDKELLRRSWYIRQMALRYPDLFTENRQAVDAFLGEVFKFEHGLRYDPGLIEARYVGMIRGFIEGSLPVRPVYVTPEIEEEFTRSWQRVPEGLALRVYADTAFHGSPRPEFHIRPFPGTSDYEPFVRRFYALAYASRAIYYRAIPEEAEAAARRARELDPGIFLKRTPG